MLLNYIIIVHEEPDVVLRPVPKDPEKAKREQAMRNLFLIGRPIRIREWSEERPEELAKALLKSLDHKSPSLRRGAARLIGAAAKEVKLKKIDPSAGLGSDKSPLEPLLPSIDPNSKKPKEKPESPMPSRALPYLLEEKALSRLRYVATMDADGTVRNAALLALERIGEVPEPLNVRPREVKS